MLTTPVPATLPANATTPDPAAYTVAPGVPARSAPRCPGSHGCGGGWNGRVTRGVPASGQRNAPGGAAPGTGGASGTPPACRVGGPPRIPGADAAPLPAAMAAPLPAAMAAPLPAAMAA